MASVDAKVASQFFHWNCAAFFGTLVQKRHEVLAVLELLNFKLEVIKLGEDKLLSSWRLDDDDVLAAGKFNQLVNACRAKRQFYRLHNRGCAYVWSYSATR